MLKDLIELDKKHFIHPTSSIQQQQEVGPKLIIEEGDGIYLKDRNGKTFIDAMSSLWNVNVSVSSVYQGESKATDSPKPQLPSASMASIMKNVFSCNVPKLVVNGCFNVIFNLRTFIFLIEMGVMISPPIFVIIS